MRYRPEPMAIGQALHLVVDAIPRKQDQRWQGVVGAYPKDDQPRGRAPSAGRSHRGSNQHRTGRLLPALGGAKAVTATARKIAVLFYNAMRFGIDYKDPGA